MPCFKNIQLVRCRDSTAQVIAGATQVVQQQYAPTIPLRNETMLLWWTASDKKPPACPPACLPACLHAGSGATAGCSRHPASRPSTVHLLHLGSSPWLSRLTRLAY